MFLFLTFLVINDDSTGNPRIFSKKMNLEAGDVETDKTDRIADRWLLGLVFEDRDHSDKNDAVRADGKNHYMFDFGEADQIFETHVFLR